VAFLKCQSWDAKEISEAINISCNSVCHSLKQLRESSQVLFKGHGEMMDHYQYKFKE